MSTTLSTGQRPNDLLTSMLTFWGLPDAGIWVEHHAPPEIAAQDTGVQTLLLAVMAILVGVMIVAPLWRSWQGDFATDTEVQGTPGCRAAATVWLVFLVSVALGLNADSLASSALTSASTVAWLAAPVILVMITMLMLPRQPASLEALAIRRNRLAALGRQLLVAALFAVVALAYAAAAPPLSVLSWLFTPESEIFKRAKYETSRGLDKILSSDILTTGPDSALKRQVATGSVR